MYVIYMCIFNVFYINIFFLGIDNILEWEFLCKLNILYLYFYM